VDKSNGDGSEEEKLMDSCAEAAIASPPLAVLNDLQFSPPIWHLRVWQTEPKARIVNELAQPL
jgi:hypothetical protein